MVRYCLYTSQLYKNDCPTKYDIDKTIFYKNNEYGDKNSYNSSNFNKFY